MEKDRRFPNDAKDYSSSETGLTPEELVERAERVGQQILANMTPEERALLREVSERYHRDSRDWLNRYLDYLNKDQDDK